MRTKTLLSLFVTLFITTSTFASKPETITFSNINKSETGCVKEFIFCEKDTQIPVSKTIYIYDEDNRMLEKVTYKWNGNGGWTGVQKYEYLYDENNQVETPKVSSWNLKTNSWSVIR